MSEHIKLHKYRILQTQKYTKRTQEQETLYICVVSVVLSLFFAFSQIFSLSSAIFSAIIQIKTVAVTFDIIVFF